MSFRVNQTNTTSNYNTSWWGSNDNSGNAKYAGMSASSKNIVVCGNCTTGSTSTALKYLINSPVVQRTGSYTGDVTFTALVNP